MKKSLLACAVLVSLASAASASIVGSFVPVLTEAGTSPPAGFVSQDLSVVATTDWTGTELIINLTAGTIYQDTFSSAGYAPPNEAFFASFPALRWDTYATGKGHLENPSSAGAAVDIGPNTAKWDTAGINQQWFTTALTDTGTFTLGRFTLSNNAIGTFTMRLDSAQSTPLLVQGVILNGLIGGVPIPEPSSAFLSVAGLFSLLSVGMRRRKK